MAIINDQAPAPTGPAPEQAVPTGPAQAAPAAPAQQGGQTQATPEEQQAYEKVVLAGIQVINSDEAHSSIMEMVGNEASGGSAKRLSRATMTVMNKLDEDSKGTIPEVVIIPAAVEILENIAEMANSSGVLPVDEALQNRAAQIMMTEMAETYGFSEADAQEIMGGVDQQTLDAATQQQSQLEGEAPQQAAPQQAPAQAMPSIINSTLG